MAEKKILLQGPFVSMAAGLSREPSLEVERDLTWKGRAAGAGDLGEQPWSLSTSRASWLELKKGISSGTPSSTAIH